MKLTQLVSGIKIPINNEEEKFIETHGDSIKISTLDEHNLWIARNLVRRGLYNLSEDNLMLIKEVNE